MIENELSSVMMSASGQTATGAPASGVLPSAQVMTRPQSDLAHTSTDASGNINSMFHNNYTMREYNHGNRMTSSPVLIPSQYDVQQVQILLPSDF